MTLTKAPSIHWKDFSMPLLSSTATTFRHPLKLSHRNCQLSINKCPCQAQEEAMQRAEKQRLAILEEKKQKAKVKEVKLASPDKSEIKQVDNGGFTR